MVMTAFLTLAAMFGSVSTFTPRISYTTKLDNWMVTCIIFVFFALMELVFVVLMKDVKSEKLQKPKPRNKVLGFVDIDSSHGHHTPEGVTKCNTFVKIASYDNAFLTIFLVSFFIFNLVYWVELIALKEDFS